VRIALVGLESVNAVAAPTGEAAQAPE
jgi:hypothetical protein